MLFYTTSQYPKTNTNRGLGSTASFAFPPLLSSVKISQKGNHLPDIKSAMERGGIQVNLKSGYFSKLYVLSLNISTLVMGTCKQGLTTHAPHIKNISRHLIENILSFLVI